jgi:hypothetical protein
LGAALIASAVFLFYRDDSPPPEGTHAIDVMTRVTGREATGLRLESLARFAGGLELNSPDPGFAEFSALWVDERGESFVAISDSARVFRGRLEWTRGQLSGLSATTLGALRSPDGGFVIGRRFRDAEAIAREPFGFLVAFEREHRVWRYATDLESGPRASGALPPLPGEVWQAPSNGGPEAMTRLADGRVLVIIERLPGTTPASRRAYLLEEGAWRALDYARTEEMDPVGAETLPNGDIVVLERSSPSDWARGIRARIRRVEAASVRGEARLDGPVVASFDRSPATENLEGIAAFAEPAGETILVLISDGGGLPGQRSIVVALRLAASL